MGFKQHISRTWQMIEQQVNDVPFRPDDEADRRRSGGQSGSGAGSRKARGAAGRKDRLFEREG